LTIARKLREAFDQAILLRYIGRLFTLCGKICLGESALNASKTYFSSDSARSVYCDYRGNLTQSEGVTFSYLAEQCILLGRFAVAQELADLAWTHAACLRFERDFVRAALMQGRAAAGAGAMQRANERLYYALTRARAANLVEFELPALIAIAKRGWTKSGTVSNAVRI
jgi:hypothetical protein